MLPITVTGGAEPSGAVGGAEPERIEIVDGKGLVIPVPATAEKGFMILKSKPAK